MSQEAKQRWQKRGICLGALALVITIALLVAALYYRDDLVSIAKMAGYSLVGVLITSFIAGSTVSVTVIPVPYVILVFTLPGLLASHWGILAPVWVGLTAASGASLGQLLTFMIGYGSRTLSQRVTTKINSRFYTRAIGWAQKYGSWAVFFMSAIINPIHLPMTIAIAALRFPPPKFFLFSFLGNAVKSLVIAFAGYFGLSSLFRFLDIL